MNLTKSVALANSPGKVETSIRGATKATNATDTEKCTGLTDLATKVNGTTEFKTAWAGWSSPMDA